MIAAPRIGPALLVAGFVAAPATAAFEWEHPSPASWVAGESPYRWPAADSGAGWRIDFAVARPWSWPELRADAVRAAIGRSRAVFGVSMAQLTSDLYRETRWAAAFEQERRGQRLAVGGSLLDLRGGVDRGTGVAGAELDLAWSAPLAWVSLGASATGIWQSPGAVTAGAPRTFALHVRSTGAGALLEARYEDGTRGRRFRVGLLAPVGPLRIGAGWSTAEPAVRCMAEVRRGSLGLSGGIAWHSELPPSESVALAIGARPGAP